MNAISNVIWKAEKVAATGSRRVLTQAMLLILMQAMLFFFVGLTPSASVRWGQEFHICRCDGKRKVTT
jgi:hypothetical protein